MAELITEHWWHLSLAVAIAVVFAVAHRVCANLAFDVSYRKGFFTQGTIFGMLLGFPGVLFVSTWRQIDSPNSANQQQLELTPDGGQERWANVLAQLSLGVGLFYYQLVVQAFLHTPKLGSAWFWLASLALLVTGWFQFRGCYPSYAMMPPLKGEDYNDPPELIEMATKRHQWGLSHERRLVANNLANAAAWAGGAGALGLYIILCLPLPFMPWLLAACCLAVMVLGAGAWFLLRRRATDLDWECDKLILDSAPDAKQRELTKLKMDFFSDLYQMRQIHWLRIGMVVATALPIIVSLLIAILAGRPLHFIVAVVVFIALLAISPWVRRRYEELEHLAQGLEDRDRRIGELSREVEIEIITRAREQSREEVGEVYTFEMGDLVSRGNGPADSAVNPQAQPELDPDLKEEMERDQQERAVACAQVAYQEVEYFHRLRSSRAWAFWGGAGVLALMLVLELVGYKPLVVAPLKYSALGCFVLATASFLPERFPALRDPGCATVIARLAAAVVVIIVGWALIAGRPGV